MERVYRIGTRTSPLALRQVEEVLGRIERLYPAARSRIVGIDTYGDRDRATPISAVEGSDFFTKEIDEALLEGEIDLAVHSAKDLPDRLRDGLIVAAVTERLDPHDALVSKRGLALDKLPHGAGIGTSSMRRKAGLARFRPDFKITDIRGNIGERLRLLDETNLDGIVIAACGLIRLGLEERIRERISFDIIEPHSLQGALAVVIRSNDTELIRLLSAIDAKGAGVLS